MKNTYTCPCCSTTIVVFEDADAEIPIQEIICTECGETIPFPVINLVSDRKMVYSKREHIPIGLVYRTANGKRVVQVKLNSKHRKATEDIPLEEYLELLIE